MSSATRVDAATLVRRVGRDPAEMRYVFSAEASVLRDSEAEAARVAREIGRKNGGWEGRGRRGPRRGWPRSWHPTRSSRFYLDMPPPFDDETLVRFIGEVADAPVDPRRTAGHPGG